MSGVDLDTGHSPRTRGAPHHDDHPARGLLLALAALALSVGLLAQSRASEASRPARDDRAPPAVEPDGATPGRP